MKHIITYTDNVPALIARSREVIDQHIEIGLDEEADEIKILLSKIGVFYNEIDGVVYSGALVVSHYPYDEDGNLYGLFKSLEGVLEILAVGRTDDVNDCPFEKIFADPKLLVKYLNFCPRGFVKDLDGNDTDELKPLVGFGRYDL